MRDIRLPEISDKFIDISDINENTSGIILAYKCNKPVGFIGYNNEDINGNISMILLQIVVLNVMKICQHY